jgi:hypothetical protein
VSLPLTELGTKRLLFPASQNFAPKSLRFTVQGVLITLDSNRIRAAVGQKRPITMKEREYRDSMMAGWTGELDLREWREDVYDMTEALFSPSTWLSEPALYDLAASLTWLSPEEQSDFCNNPDEFVNSSADDWMFQSLLNAYSAYIGQSVHVAARTRAVSEMLTESVGFRLGLH